MDNAIHQYSTHFVRINENVIKTTFTLDEKPNGISLKATGSLPPLIVLDLSGSMAGSRINKCKIFLQNLLKDQDSFHLIGYNSNAHYYGLIKSLPSLQPGGMTHFDAAFEKILSILNDTDTTQSDIKTTFMNLNSANNILPIIFLTDGEETVSQCVLSDLKNFSAKMKPFTNCVIHTIAIECEAHVELLLHLCKCSHLEGTFGFLSTIGGQDTYDRECQRLMALIFSQYNSKMIIFNDKKYLIPNSTGYLDVYMEDKVKDCAVSTNQNDKIDYMAFKLDQMASKANSINIDMVKEIQAEVQKIFSDAGALPRTERKNIRTNLMPLYSIINEFYNLLSQNQTINNVNLAKLNVASRDSRSSRFDKISLQRSEVNKIEIDKEDLIIDLIATTFSETSMVLVDNKHLKIDDEICILSQLSVMELLKSGDCMGVGIGATGGETCIVDPTMLKINHVSGCFFGCDAFLDASVYKANIQPVTYGQQNNIIVDGAREPISGVIPLYINETHWKIAQHYVKRMSAHLCCKDPYLANHKIIFYTYLKAIRYVSHNTGERFENIRLLLIETLQKIYETITPTVIPSPLAFLNSVDQRVASVVSSLSLLLSAYNILNLYDKYNIDEKQKKMIYHYSEEEKFRRKNIDWNIKDLCSNFDLKLWVYPYINRKFKMANPTKLSFQTKYFNIIQYVESRLKDQEAANKLKIVLKKYSQDDLLNTNDSETDENSKNMVLNISDFIPEYTDDTLLKGFCTDYCMERKILIINQLKRHHTESDFVAHYTDLHIMDEKTVIEKCTLLFRDLMELERQSHLTTLISEQNANEDAVYFNYLINNDVDLLERIAILHGTCYIGRNIFTYYKTVNTIDDLKMLLQGHYDISKLIGHEKPILIPTVMDKHGQFQELWWNPSYKQLQKLIKKFGYDNIHAIVPYQIFHNTAHPYINKK